MTEPTRSRRWSAPAVVAACLVLLFGAIALWYSLAIPAGEGVDEVPHFTYVHYVRDNWTLPVQPWRDNGHEMQVWMGHHPPLYYVAGALLSVWTDTSDWEKALRPNPHFAWTETDPSNGWNVYLHDAARFPLRGTLLALHYLRLWSIVMGAVTLFAIYGVGRLLLPDKPWVSVSAVAVVAFNPSFLFMSSTIHHDPLIVMIFALSLWWMVHALETTPTVRGALVGGLLLAAGLLTKLSGLSLIALFGLTLLLIAHRTRSWQPLVRLGVPLFGVALIGAGWWYARNHLLYGDPLGWQMFLTTHQHMVRRDPYGWFFFRHEFLAQLGRTFWGAFGYMHILLPLILHRVLWGITGVAILGALGAAVAAARRLWHSGRWRQWLVLGVAALLVFLSFVRFSMATTGAGHGRYLFTIAVPFGLTVAIGLNAWTRFRAQRLTAALVTLGLMSLALVVLPRFVLPRYPMTETVDPAALSSIEAPTVRFGEALELVGYTWEPASVPPGSTTELTLYWRALGTERADLFVRLALRDRSGSLFFEESFWPIPSSSTTVWDPERVYVTRRTLFIGPNVQPGQSTLEIAVQPGREGEPLTMLAAGASTGAVGQLAGPLVGQASGQPLSEVAPSFPRNEHLSDEVALLGYDIAATTLTPGGELALDLYWRAERPIERNLTVFVQVLNQQMQVVAQQDNEPNGGQYPTSLWQPGEVVKDPYRIPLPPELPPGEYTLIAGMYEWPSLERLPVMVDGQLQGDTIFLTPIQIEAAE